MQGELLTNWTLLNRRIAMDYTNDLNINFLPEKIRGKIGFISKFLKNDERILLGVSGYLPMSIFERLYSGIIDILLYKKCILLFTNKRIFCIHVKVNYSYKNIIQEILYEDIKDFEFKKGKIFIQYKNLKKNMFRVNKNLSEEIINKIKEYIKNHNTATYSNGLHYICPRCGNGLVKGIYNCCKCNLEFVNKEKMIKYSIILIGIIYLFNKNFINYLMFIIVTVVEFAALFSAFLYIKYYFETSLKGIIYAIYALIVIIGIPILGYLSLKLSEEFIPKYKIYIDK